MVRVLLPLALLLLLSGCAASPSTEHGAEPAAAAHGEEGEETYAFLPLSFPVDDVPLVDGELLNVSQSGGIWSIWYESHDLSGDLAAAASLLLGAGYEQNVADPAYGEFADAHYMLRVVASESDTYGPSLYYMILPLDEPVEAEEEPAESH
jgi:hypothetical protein